MLDDKSAATIRMPGLLKRASLLEAHAIADPVLTFHDRDLIEADTRAAAMSLLGSGVGGLLGIQPMREWPKGGHA
jgi:hypothetical protein